MLKGEEGKKQSSTLTEERRGGLLFTGGTVVACYFRIKDS